MDSVALIRTKLYRPRLASDLVERPRLMERLNRNPNRTLTLVAAPAGYGKSTLVARWLERGERPSAWLSLDRNDSDLGVFVRYFIAAVQTLFPDAGKETLGLLQLPTAPRLQVLAATLLNELDRIEQPFILTLDDYHLIHDLAVHDLMNELLRHAPRSFHLALISRLNPPFNLHRLRAHGQMMEVRADALRFTPAETRAFAQQVWHASLDEEAAVRLQETTEGWATGLRLCFLSIKGPEGFDALADRLPGRRLATEYLFHEVFTSQPKAIREHLLSTSILDRFSASLCEHLRDGGTTSESMSGQAFIDWLQQADIFVIALDHEREWFRYHHLFQDLLQRQLAQIYDDEAIARLHARASEWFTRNGLIEEAIRHALAAGDPPKAARLVEQNKTYILNADRWPVLVRWLSYLPEDLIRQRPTLLLARMWIAVFHYDMAELVHLLAQFEALMGETEMDKATQGEWEYYQGVPEFWAGNVEQSIAYFERALPLISPEEKAIQAQAELYLAVGYQMTGQAERAIQMLRVLLDQEREGGLRRGRLLAALIFVHLLSGQLTPAYRLANLLLEMAENTENAFYIGWASYLLGRIHFAWHEPEAAIPHFVRAVEKRRFMDQKPAIDSYIGLMLSYQILGQPERADETVAQLLTYVQESRTPSGMLYVQSAQIRLALLQPDIERAVQLQRETDPSEDRATMLFVIELPRVTQCRVLIAQGTEARLNEAISRLQALLQSAGDTHNISQQIVLLSLLALARHRRGETEAALALLAEAVTLAEPGGWIHAFVEEGEEMARLLKALIESKPSAVPRAFIQRILQIPALQQSRKPSPPALYLADPLTNRELDILTLLARRYSNKEIANELFISVATVKRHASNIYGKLQVSGRRAAVEKAIGMGLITVTDELRYPPTAQME